MKMSGSFVRVRGVGLRLSDDSNNRYNRYNRNCRYFNWGLGMVSEQNGKRSFDFVRFFVPLQN